MIASLIASLPIKSGFAATESYYPTETNDDGFITQIGNHFADTPYLRLRSPTTDIVNGLRFRSLNIPQDAKINNATLFVRTFHTYDAGLVISTIYGVNENDAYAFDGSGDFTRPYTSSNVVWNVSEVNGNSWHNVSVTNIVQEIISRYGWRTGNDLAFIILADSGEPRREFASFDNNIIYRPRLEITYDVTPPDDPSDQADAPYNDTSLWDWELDDTYRGFDIWNVTYSNDNRTGEGCDVNWNEVNQTELTEQDAGGDITVNNATWSTVTTMLIPFRDSLFNDTGAANINSYFLRFAVNMTEVFKGGAPDVIPSFYGLSTISPAAGSVDGYAYGVNGDWVGLVCIVDADQTRWRVSVRERTGGVGVVGSGTGWFSTANLNIIYWEVKVNMTGTPYIQWTYFYDAEFQTAIASATRVLVWATGPFRYPQTISGMGLAGTNRDSFEYYTFLDFTLATTTVQFISYPNGTLVDPDPITEDPEDIIDDLLGGADPEDPETDKYGTALTKNRWKTFVFVIGMVMFLGTPTFAMMARVSTGRWIMVLFISLCGLSILWSLIYM